eukprot:scaffold5032_cov88-Isochrysis_galbana.AAC.7
MGGFSFGRGARRGDGRAASRDGHRPEHCSEEVFFLWRSFVLGSGAGATTGEGEGDASEVAGEGQGRTHPSQ